MATTKKAQEFVLSSLSVNIASCKKNDAMLRALLHPLRQKFMVMMDKAKTKSLNVSAFINKLDLEQSVASQHLAILRNANLVVVERVGREKLYSVNYGALTALNKALGLLK